MTGPATDNLTLFTRRKTFATGYEPAPCLLMLITADRI
jgi:hypothetical protein